MVVLILNGSLNGSLNGFLKEIAVAEEDAEVAEFAVVAEVEERQILSRCLLERARSVIRLASNAWIRGAVGPEMAGIQRNG